MRGDVIRELNKELEAGRPGVLVTVLQTSGSTPRKAGSQMLVRLDEGFFGTIGGGLAEATAIAEAYQTFKSKVSSLHRLTMNASVAATDGMACGGEMEVFIQYVPTEIQTG